jgi:prefoldin subunit 5
MFFPGAQNQALINQLQNRLNTLNTQISSLESARDSLRTHEGNLTNSRSTFVSARNTMRNCDLSRSIRVSGLFQGLCAEESRARYRTRRQAISTRAQTPHSIITGLNSQIGRIDTRLASLRSERSSVINQLNNL